MKREGWYDPEEAEFTAPVVMGPKVFTCPFCGTGWKITPVKNATGRYWDYIGDCQQCGANWVERYHAWRKPSPKEKIETRATRSVLPPEED